MGMSTNFQHGMFNEINLILIDVHLSNGKNLYSVRENKQEIIIHLQKWKQVLGMKLTYQSWC